MRAHHRTWTVVALASIATTIISPSVQIFAAQDASSTNHWNMTYHAGAAPIRPEDKIGVTIEGQKLLLRVKKGPEFAILLNQITAVSSNVTGHYGRVSLAEVKFVDSWAPRCGQMDVGCGAAVLTALLLVVPSYPIKTTDRLVQIVWRDKNLDEEVVLKLRKSDYEPFLDQLQKATAKPWKNLDTEWAKVQQELKAAESGKAEIHLDRKVKMMKSDLGPGTYQIVLLDREVNQGELYFFPGDEVNTEMLAAVVPVEIATMAGGASTPEVEYKQGVDGMTTISAIRTQSKEIRFP